MIQNVANQCNGSKLLHLASLVRHSIQHKAIDLWCGSVWDIYEFVCFEGDPQNRMYLVGLYFLIHFSLLNSFAIAMA